MKGRVLDALKSSDFKNNIDYCRTSFLLNLGMGGLMGMLGLCVLGLMM